MHTLHCFGHVPGPIRWRHVTRIPKYHETGHPIAETLEILVREWPVQANRKKCTFHLEICANTRNCTANTHFSKGNSLFCSGYLYVLIKRIIFKNNSIYQNLQIPRTKQGVSFGKMCIGRTVPGICTYFQAKRPLFPNVSDVWKKHWKSLCEMHGRGHQPHTWYVSLETIHEKLFNHQLSQSKQGLASWMKRRRNKRTHFLHTCHTITEYTASSTDQGSLTIQ